MRHFGWFSNTVWPHFLPTLSSQQSQVAFGKIKIKTGVYCNVIGHPGRTLLISRCATFLRSKERRHSVSKVQIFVEKLKLVKIFRKNLDFSSIIGNFYTLFLKTVCKNLHFLSKNSTLISRENCWFFWGGKLVKMLWFWTF